MLRPADWTSPPFTAARVSFAPNEQLPAEPGAMTATSSDPAVQSQIRRVAGGVVQSMKSGEGFVFDFTGPGWVMTQSRNPAALEAWVRQIMPGQTGRASGVSGALGGFLGR